MRRRLEGIVSKRVDAPYRSGYTCDWIKVDWIKVKCASWREGNKLRRARPCPSRSRRDKRHPSPAIPARVPVE